MREGNFRDLNDSMTSFWTIAMPYYFYILEIKRVYDNNRIS